MRTSHYLLVTRKKKMAEKVPGAGKMIQNKRVKGAGVVIMFLWRRDSQLKVAD